MRKLRASCMPGAMRSSTVGRGGMGGGYDPTIDGICIYNLSIYLSIYPSMYMAISLHSGVIAFHSGVRQLQVVPIISLSGTLGKQMWHWLCMFQHTVQQTPAVNLIHFYLLLLMLWTRYAPLRSPRLVFWSMNATVWPFLDENIKTVVDKKIQNSWQGTPFCKVEFLAIPFCRLEKRSFVQHTTKWTTLTPPT